MIYRENLHRYVVREAVQADVRVRTVDRGENWESVFAKRAEAIKAIKKGVWNTVYCSKN